MNIFTIMMFLMTTARAWTPSSWQTTGLPYQIPQYSSQKELDRVVAQLRHKSPLIFAGECRRLEQELEQVWAGRGFVLMGGDCAETFNDFSINRVRDDYLLLMRMKLVMTHASGLPVATIARTAGQFAKPRSNLWGEDGIRNYQGDIINSMVDREPDPTRMLTAYHQSVQTLNLIRAFQQGGISDVQVLHQLNRQQISSITGAMNPDIQDQYLGHLSTMEKTIRFIRATTQVQPTLGPLYTGHECLLLPYEQGLTRQDSTSEGELWYDTSAHFLWLGERTRKRNASHVEFMRGISNPIGIKVSASTSVRELLEIIDILNPTSKPGRIALISRMGHEILPAALPPIVEQCRKKNVIWICDPMHGNTFSVGGVKTRSIHHIHKEIRGFFRVMDQTGTHPGGIHLEMTSDNVAECIGGAIDTVSTESIAGSRYRSACDPRLNAGQAFETAFLIASLFSSTDSGHTKGHSSD